MEAIILTIFFVKCYNKSTPNGVKIVNLMGDKFMEVFEIMLDILDNLIFDKAFNKKINRKRRLSYILLYYMVIILLLAFAIFLGVNYIKQKNIIGYFSTLVSIILFLLLVLPLFRFKNKR